ncbi:MAG: pyridoxal phosphate-dependent aminotransferase [Sphingomonadales bacterium]
MMAQHHPDPRAGAATLDAIRQNVRRIPVDNIAALVAEGGGDKNFIPLWFGEGDLPTPDFICQAAIEALRGGDTFYMPQNGIPELRRGLADYLSSLHGISLGPERITVTVGGMGAILLAISLVAGEGDNIIVVDPVWPNIKGMVEIAGAEVRPVAMDLGEEGWSLDPEKIAANVDGRTRAVFLASPGNPTGAVVSREAAEALLELSRQHGFWILADEVYSRLHFELEAAPSFLDLAEDGDRLLVINSFSKSWSMTGWRIGWLVHPPELEETLAMMVQFTTSGVAPFLQQGALAALTKGGDFVAQVRRRCKRGCDLVYDALQGSNSLRLQPKPVAGMYVNFAVEGKADSREAARAILRESGVGLAPGAFFGEVSEGWLRLCANRDEAILREAAGRLARIGE